MPQQENSSAAQLETLVINVHSEGNTERVSMDTRIKVKIPRHYGRRDTKERIDQ